MAAYFAAIGVGMLMPFVFSAIALLPFIGALLVTLVLALALGVGSYFAGKNGHEREAVILGIASGDCVGNAIGLSINRVVQWLNEPQLIHIEGDSSVSSDGCIWDDVNQEIDDWFGDNSGPVEFTAPPDASPEEIAQIKEYVSGCNRAAIKGQLSPTGRVSTKGELRYQANVAARNERIRAENAGIPYKGVVGHVPDTTWINKPEPPMWADQIYRVNSSLGGQSLRYPIGYKPTYFIFKG